MALWRRQLTTFLVCGLAMGWLAGAARAVPPAPVATARQPEIRLIEPGRDDPALARIEIVRASLPEKNRRRNNFAWAVAKIEGLDKTEYYAHSGINGLGGLSAEAAARIPDVSPRCKKGRFEILCVNVLICSKKTSIKLFRCSGRLVLETADPLNASGATSIIRSFNQSSIPLINVSCERNKI